MATTMQESPTQAKAPRRFTGPVACGTVAGALFSTCCTVGVAPVITWATTVTGGYFALSKFTPAGATPFMVGGMFLLSGLAAWLVMRRRTRSMARPVARAVTRRGVRTALLTSGVTYFVLMGLVLPGLFAIGALNMGQFSPMMPSMTHSTGQHSKGSMHMNPAKKGSMHKGSMKMKTGS